MSNPITIRIAAIGLLTFLAAVAVAQQQSAPQRSGSGARSDGKVASVEEPDFTRFRVVTDQGILAVFDAVDDWDGRDEPASQLAYWNDFATQQFFFFDQLLFTDADVLQSVTAMQRDLQIDPAQILNEKTEFVPLPEPTGPGQWRPATELDVLTVMAGGILGAREDGGVSGLPLPCDPVGCPEPQSATGPIAGPVTGAHPETNCLPWPNVVRAATVTAAEAAVPAYAARSFLRQTIPIRPMEARRPVAAVVRALTVIHAR